MWVFRFRPLVTVVVLLATQANTDGESSHCLELGLCNNCERGWYGDNCNVRCIGHCNITGCNKSTGSCLQCDHGYYSDNCTMKCSSNCRDNFHEKVDCHRHTGNCLEGCKTGYYGDLCKKRCIGECIQWNGTFINGCKHCNSCSLKCANKVCYYNETTESVVCTQGCIPGKMSASCDQDCPDNCTICDQTTGKCQTCKKGYWEQTCGSVCVDTCLNQTCALEGNCHICVPDSHGARCDHSCSEECSNCFQANGNCTSSQTKSVFLDEVVIGIVIGSTVLVVLLVMLFEYRACRRSQNFKMKNQSADSAGSNRPNRQPLLMLDDKGV